MFYDIILAAIFVLMIFIGVRRGAARSLAGLLLSFASYALATFLGKLLSVNIYNWFIKPTVHNTVVNTVSDFSHDTLQDALGKIDISAIDFLGVQDSLKSSIDNSLSAPIDNISAKAGDTAVAATEPIIIGIISFFITIILFLLIYFLLRRLVLPLILSVFRLPVIKQLNAILGGVIGVINAYLVVSMLAYLLKLVIPQISTDVSLFQESTIYNSFIFKHFYDGNIFSTFASWLHL